MQVDKFLLRLFQLVSEKVYSWVGVNNFTMARICFVFCLAMEAIDSFICFTKNDFNSDFGFICLINPIILILYLFFLSLDLKRVEDFIDSVNLEEGAVLMNPLRLQWIFTRIIWLCFVFMHLLDFFQEDVNIFSLYWRIFLFCGVYFGSVNSGPKKKSKLEKGIDKLKDLAKSFVPSPSPALAPVRS